MVVIAVKRAMRQTFRIRRHPVCKHQNDNAAVIMKDLLGFSILGGTLGRVRLGAGSSESWSNFWFFQKVSLKTASDV